MSNCRVSLHEFPHFEPVQVHHCYLDEGHGGTHSCPCGRLLAHCAEARRLDREAEDPQALLDLHN